MYLKQRKSTIFCTVKSKMVNFVLFLLACVCIPFVTSWGGLLLGPGEWLVMNILHCDNSEQYLQKHEITRKKINRTHDCFDLIAPLVIQFNSSVGIKIDVFKEVDGGFKYFQSMSDGNACGFIMHHAEHNMKRALRMANIDPPECPFGPGDFILRNYVMDYRELPKHGIYGTFQVMVYATMEEKNIGCGKIILNFDRRNDDDDFD